MQPLKDKKILLGLTGSIAVYKSAYLLRTLVKYGADVHVVMTESATKFISPIIFSTFSGKNVNVDMFAPGGEITHISLAKASDLFLIAPVTANTIGKAAAGIADDLLSTVLIAGLGKTIMAPAMDLDMWQSPATEKNIEQLIKYGVKFVGPEKGSLASGLEGSGRMAMIEEIANAAVRYFLPREVKKSLKGEVVLITAGPTRESFDPIRFISNRSSGKMGYAIAESAVERSAEVILISGPTQLAPPEGVEFIRIESATEMHAAVEEKRGKATILIMAAAVSDFKPRHSSASKIKKKTQNFSMIDMEPTVDILKTTALSGENPNITIVGFAAETDNAEKNGIKKLKDKNLDFIVINNVLEEGAGFGCDTNKVLIIDRNFNKTDLPLMEKKSVADRLFEIITEQKQSV